ncbi:MAG: AAA family ATPase [Polyangiaceae bacterium]
MSRFIKLAALPESLALSQAVASAYPTELERCERALRRGLGVLVVCDKELVPHYYRALRARLRGHGVGCDYLDGRPSPGADDTVQAGRSLVAAILRQLREAVRGVGGERVIVLPHLDVLTSPLGGTTAEAREVIPLLYENPDIVWLAFEDPSFALPVGIERLFPHREVLAGVRRERLPELISRPEGERLVAENGPEPSVDGYALYECVSGMNVVRLRRVLSTLLDEESPTKTAAAFGRLRELTLGGGLTVPHVDFERDIGGYAKVKARLHREIVEVLRRKEGLDDEAEIAHLESILPRGFVLWGPSGTGKTLFAEALATSVGAAVLVAGGAELRARWMMNQTDGLRQLFVEARRSAPCVLVIDEIDAFARSQSAGATGVDHAMCKQLLTEIDSLRDNELVFVVATTAEVASLEPTLVRPGRFEFQLHVPYPSSEDRRAILRIHDDKLRLEMSPAALEHAVRSTGGIVEGTGDARYSGDHLQALCRQLARRRLREGLSGPTEPADVDLALEAYLERPALSDAEKWAVATHEAGHAICSLHCEHAPAIERISIRGDLGALGYVRYDDAVHRYVITRQQILDIICVLFGGREAERRFLDDVSAGAGQDLSRATALARVLVEELAMGGEALGPRTFADRGEALRLAETTRSAIDASVKAILAEQCARAAAILEREHSSLEQLRDALVEREVLEAEEVSALLGGRK